MTVTAQDVFVIAMNIMDEVSQDGTYDGFPDDYKKKSWSLLTTLQSELLPPSVEPIAITSNLNVMQVDDRTALTTLPYGLAAHLLFTEDQNRASFFNARYDELKRKRPAKIIPITDVNGINRNQTDTSTTDTSTFDGGDFLDPNAGTYDGGDF